MSTPITLSPPITITVDATGKLVITPSQPTPPPALTGDFTFAPTTPLMGSTVSFSASAAGGTPPYTFAWLFGDGSSGTGQTASHSYSAAGTFSVALTIRDTAGQALVVTHVITVATLPTGLTASFTFSPASPITGVSVNFSASASGGTPPYGFGWAFGDGSTGTGQTTSHSYATAGTFAVMLTVTDAAGTIATVSDSIMVSSPVSTSYTLDFEGFDFDGGGEVTLTVNNKFLASLPSTNSPQNGQINIPFSLDITKLVVQGPNTLTFQHAPWDFCAISQLQILDGNGNVVFSDATSRTLNASDSFTYNFLIGAVGPPGAQNTSLTIAATPNPSAPAQSVNVTGFLRTTTGTAVASAIVNLQQSTDNGATWTQVGTANTALNGSYSIPVTFATAGTFQIRTQFPGL